MADATFTIEGIEGVFEVVRGSGDNPDKPSNFMTFFLRKPGVPTEEDPEPEDIVDELGGFTGP